ncbi:Protein BREAST CANCER SUSCEPTIBILITY 2-like A [Porphyridium purpureum]|uniref:Protein BREAST CANCER SUSCEPTIBILITY 2-like A n=1 Tax=Porphyridium purpureum TaxID=35688 RepID=A0A5J4Z4D8_PORPP|nr:Protein BREAST CANCER SUSCEPTIBILITY 2-like A [Porphyridium purpureum]|eukprot:POR6077..scf295_1
MEKQETMLGLAFEDPVSCTSDEDQVISRRRNSQRVHTSRSQPMLPQMPLPGHQMHTHATSQHSHETQVSAPARPDYATKSRKSGRAAKSTLRSDGICRRKVAECDGQTIARHGLAHGLRDDLADAWTSTEDHDGRAVMMDTDIISTDDDDDNEEKAAQPSTLVPGTAFIDDHIQDASSSDDQEVKAPETNHSRADFLSPKDWLDAWQIMEMETHEKEAQDGKDTSIVGSTVLQTKCTDADNIIAVQAHGRSMQDRSTALAHVPVFLGEIEACASGTKFPGVVLIEDVTPEGVAQHNRLAPDLFLAQPNEADMVRKRLRFDEHHEAAPSMPNQRLSNGMRESEQTSIPAFEENQNIRKRPRQYSDEKCLPGHEHQCRPPDQLGKESSTGNPCSGEENIPSTRERDEKNEMQRGASQNPQHDQDDGDLHSQKPPAVAPHASTDFHQSGYHFAACGFQTNLGRAPQNEVVLNQCQRLLDTDQFCQDAVEHQHVFPEGAARNFILELESFEHCGPAQRLGSSCASAFRTSACVLNSKYDGAQGGLSINYADNNASESQQAKCAVQTAPALAGREIRNHEHPQDFETDSPSASDNIIRVFRSIQDCAGDAPDVDPDASELHQSRYAVAAILPSDLSRAHDFPEDTHRHGVALYPGNLVSQIVAEGGDRGGLGQKQIPCAELCDGGTDHHVDTDLTAGGLPDKAVTFATIRGGSPGMSHGKSRHGESMIVQEDDEHDQAKLARARVRPTERIAGVASSFAFTTARGKSIDISDKMLQKARTILGDGNDDGCSLPAFPPAKRAMEGASTAFATAGGKSIEVSDKMLQKARTILGDGNDDGCGLPAFPPAKRAMEGASTAFATAGGKSIEVSDKMLQKARTILGDGNDDDCGLPAFLPTKRAMGGASAAFATAGGKSIEVSDKMLQKARTILGTEHDDDHGKILARAPVERPMPSYSARLDVGPDSAQGSSESARSPLLGEFEASKGDMLDDDRANLDAREGQRSTPDLSHLAQARFNKKVVPLLHAGPFIRCSSPFQAATRTTASTRKVSFKNQNGKAPFRPPDRIVRNSDEAAASTRGKLLPRKEGLRSSNNAMVDIRAVYISQSGEYVRPPHRNARGKQFDADVHFQPRAVAAASGSTIKGIMSLEQAAQYSFAVDQLGFRDEHDVLGIFSMSSAAELLPTSRPKGAGNDQSVGMQNVLRFFSSIFPALEPTENTHCDDDRLASRPGSAVWIRNAYTLQVWRHARTRGAACAFTLRDVLVSMARRIEKEWNQVEKPPFLRLSERDALPSSPHVCYVVSLSLVPTCSGLGSVQYSMLITDGAYLLKASLPLQLGAHVVSGKIAAGTKLFITGSAFKENADMVGGTGGHGLGKNNSVQTRVRSPNPGSDPSPAVKRLEPGALDCAPLILHPNGVRGAKASAKLGVQKKLPTIHSLKSVFLLGRESVVPSVELLVLRVYPTRFVETVEQAEGQSSTAAGPIQPNYGGRRIFRTREQEEHVREEAYNRCGGSANERNVKAAREVLVADKYGQRALVTIWQQDAAYADNVLKENVYLRIQAASCHQLRPPRAGAAIRIIAGQKSVLRTFERSVIPRAFFQERTLSYASQAALRMDADLLLVVLLVGPVQTIGSHSSTRYVFCADARESLASDVSPERIPIVVVEFRDDDAKNIPRIVSVAQESLVKRLICLGEWSGGPVAAGARDAANNLQESADLFVLGRDVAVCDRVAVANTIACESSTRTSWLSGGQLVRARGNGLYAGTLPAAVQRRLDAKTPAVWSALLRRANDLVCGRARTAL